MLLKKMLNLDAVELKFDGDAGKFSGYASVFGGVDSYGDTIIKGAFESTLRKAKPKMFWNHQWDMPIGKWTKVREDDKGLFVEGELTPGHSLSADVRAALKHGTLDGLSIGGFLKAGDFEETENGRIIRKWSELSEISPVAFPADLSARVDLDSVKADQLALIGGIDTIRDFESFLRDAGGLSKGAALALTARARDLFGRGDHAPDESQAKMAEIAARLQRLAI
jgi:HK97 family phage prohead protease